MNFKPYLDAVHIKTAGRPIDADARPVCSGMFRP